MQTDIDWCERFALQAIPTMKLLIEVLHEVLKFLFEMIVGACCFILILALSASVLLYILSNAIK